MLMTTLLFKQLCWRPAEAFRCYGLESYHNPCIFEQCINRKPNANEDMKKYDLRHEATVILLGAIGKHLSKDDPKILHH